MRVLYSFPDGIGRAGIGTTAFHQVREVALQGVDVELYCTSLHGELPTNVTVVQTLAVGGRRIPHRALGIERSYRYHDLRVAAALRRMGSTVDVVHCWPRATVHTCSAAHRANIPCLREVPNTHTGHAFDVVASERERLGMPPARRNSHTFDGKRLRREELEYGLADGLLVPSEYSRRTFLERGYPKEKLVLHRYGCDTTRFFAARTATAQSDRPLVAAFVGRCEPRKGLHYALRAWFDSGAAEEGRFVVCGSFEPAYRTLLDPLLVDPSVEVIDFVPDPSIVMREADVLILPSLEEGSALVTYEAQASGCVLAVSEAAGARCRHGVEGLVHAPGAVAELTEHLTRLREDRELLERLRAATLGQATSLSWATAGRELVEIYGVWARAAAA